MKEYIKAAVELVSLESDIVSISNEATTTTTSNELTTTAATTTNSSEIPDSDSTIEQ